MADDPSGEQDCLSSFVPHRNLPLFRFSPPKADSLLTPQMLPFQPCAATTLQEHKKGKMIIRRFVAAASLAFAQPACADVIMPGPPIVPIQITASQASTMAKAARSAALRIFDFSKTDRPTYLDEAVRAAGSKGITGIAGVVSVRVLGDRAFVLAVATKYLGPLVIGETYTYMQCGFDERGRVNFIAVDI